MEGSEPSSEQPTITWPGYGYWVRVAAAVIGIVVALRVVLILQATLIVVLASFVLAIGLQPAITYLESKGLSRVMAIASIIVGINIVLIAGLWGVIPTAVEQVNEVTTRLPEIKESIAEWGELGSLVAEQIDPEALLEDEEQVGRTVGTVATTVFNLFTVAVLTPYFAFSFPRIKRWILRLVKKDERPDLLALLNDSSERISGYILGNLAISVLAGIVSYLGFRLLGLPYALVLAIWVAFTDLIPIIGAFLGAIPALAVASELGVESMIAVALLLLVYQLLENYLVSPRVMTRAIDLSPAAVIIAVMIGGTLAGVAGALLALPLAAMIKVAFQQYVLTARLETVRADGANGAGNGKKRRRGVSRPLP